jgi:hypothetical protein
METEKRSEWWISAMLGDAALRQGQLEYLVSYFCNEDNYDEQLS